MKKAKIILGALTALAVVGGTLAFNAQKTFNGNLRCTEVYGDKCPFGTFTTDQFNGHFSYCTEVDAPENTPCTFYTKITFDQ